ncbi:MAG: winged helix-turn-helix transcriptional regulator [Alcanivoracaceae bacterium]|nr:winged helix-turn-helix transcriptional regulator [Alcanivoracaceae bacterium]
MNAEQKIDRLFHALSDSSRRRMLLMLSKKDSSVSELGEPLCISKQLVSKHIKVLETAGLVTKTREGRVQRCKYNAEAMNEVSLVVEQYKKFWGKQFDILEKFVEEIKNKE